MATHKLTSFRVSDGHCTITIDASCPDLRIDSAREAGMGAILVPADLLVEFIEALKEIRDERDPCPY